MKPQYLHRITESFYLWLDHTILNGDGYRNLSTGFEEQPSKFNGWKYYSSPYGQFVSDSSITGANIPTITPPSGVNIKVDYLNGGVYASDPLTNPTADVSVKDFNVYLSNEHQSMVFLNQASGGEDIYRPNKGTKRNTYVAPCVLISPMPAYSEGFALGGTKKTELTMSLVVITDNYYNLMGLSSILNDTVDGSFIALDFGFDSPYDIFGSLKDSTYSYPSIINKTDFNRSVLIKAVNSKGITPTENNNQKTSFISIINFTLEDIRIQ